MSEQLPADPPRLFRPPQIELTADDDGFHRISDDPWFTEGSWWCFHNRERRLMGWIYHLNRLNLGYASGGVWLWDDSATMFYEAPYYRFAPYQPLAADADLRRITWPDGVSLETLTPLHRYRLRYEHSGYLSIDLTYTGLMEPHVSLLDNQVGLTRLGLDHACQVTGRIHLHGEPIDIDCYAFRDHSWGRRADDVTLGQPITDPAALAGRGVTWMWAISSPRDGFFIYRDHGYLTRDGLRQQLVEFEQRVERDDSTGFPTRLSIRGKDASGRVVSADGSLVSRIVRPAGSGSVACNGFVEWEFDGGRCYGDIQDVWPIADWAALRRWERRSGSATQALITK